MNTTFTRIAHFLLLAIAAATMSLAQPTLSSGTFSISPNTSLIYSFCDVSTFQEGNAGANQTWDFSGVQVDSTKSVTTTDPASTPGGSNFPSATVAVPELLGNDLLSGFFEFGASQVVYHGYQGTFSTQGINTEIQAVYTNPEIFVTYPLNFNDTQTDELEGQVSTTTANIPTNSVRKGTFSINYDGYGTLILPSGTYQNVMRIRYNESYQDSSNLAGQPFILTVTTENIIWIQEGSELQLVQFNRITTNGLPSENLVFYQDQSTNIASPQLVKDFTVGPNPMVDKAVASFSLSEAHPVTMRLLSLKGQEIKRMGTRQLGAGEHEWELTVENLPTGLYLLGLKVGTHEELMRIRVQ